MALYCSWILSKGTINLQTVLYKIWQRRVPSEIYVAADSQVESIDAVVEQAAQHRLGRARPPECKAGNVPEFCAFRVIQVGAAHGTSFVSEFNVIDMSGTLQITVWDDVPHFAAGFCGHVTISAQDLLQVKREERREREERDEREER